LLVPLLAAFFLAAIVKKRVILNLEKKIFIVFVAFFALWSLVPFFLRLSKLPQEFSYLLALASGMAFLYLCESYSTQRTVFKLIKHSFFTTLYCVLACAHLIYHIAAKPLPEGFIGTAIDRLYFFLMLWIFLRALGRLQKERKKFTFDKQKNTRYQLLFFGGIAAMAHIAAYFLNPDGFPFFKTLLGLAALLLVAYAVIKEFSLNMEAILKRTVLYTILYSTIVGLFVVTLVAVSNVLFYGSGIPGRNVMLMCLITLLIVTSLVKPLDKFLSQLTDKFLLQKRYEYQNLLKEAAKGMTQITDITHLIKIITHFVALRLRVTHVGIMFKDKESYVLRESRGDKKKQIGLRIPADSTLVKWLEEKKDILTLDELKYWLSVPNQSLFKPILKESLVSIKTQMDALNSTICIPSFGKQKLLGFMLLGEKLSGEPFMKEDKVLLSTLAHEASVAIENALLYDELLKQLKEIKNLYEREHQMFIQTAIAFANAIDAKDAYTHGHTERVTTFSVAVARELINSGEARNIPNFIDTVHFAALLHDVGKIGIPDKILNKKGKLNKREVELMKMHPIIGASIIYPIKGLTFVANAVKHHHEFYNGKGYPDGLKTKDIPFISRIIAIADAFDAMTTDRPYRPKIDEQQAMHEVLKNAGNQFDPLIAEIFVEVFKKRKISRSYSSTR
jgi:HD-GYP domain-containing protein (c-di-GMP phosphodiesterase class II)